MNGGRRGLHWDAPGEAAPPAPILASADDSAGLFVGIGRFAEEELETLPCAVDDAVDLAWLFCVQLDCLDPRRVCLALAGDPAKPQTGERLRRLRADGAEVVQALRGDIFHAVGTLARATRPAGTFLVSFATHGFEKGDSYYLATSDTRRGNLERQSIVARDFFSDVDQAPARTRMILLDACREHWHSDDGAGGTVRRSAVRRGTDHGLERSLRSLGDSIVLKAAPRGGFAYEDSRTRNGVFTAAVLAALGGAAPVDDEGFITLGGLASYVNQQVLDWVRRHEPAEHARLMYGVRAEMVETARALRLARAEEVRRRIHRQRCKDALARLIAHLDPPLGTEHLARANSVLAGEEPTDAASDLLERLETLTGDRASREALAYHLERLEETAPDTAAGAASRIDEILELHFRWEPGLGFPEFRQRVEEAAADDVVVRAWMATLLLLGINGFPRDRQAAEALARESVEEVEARAAAGSIGAAVVAGFLHDDGLGVPKDAQTALARWQPLAEDGDFLGAFCLGYWLCGQSRRAEAAPWYRKAAEAGNLSAMINLANLHEHGNGVEKDPALAERLYRRAAEAGSVRAMIGLGSLLEHGRNGEADPRQAADWFRRAAELGSGEAMGCLAVLVSRGEGVEKDPEEALRLSRKGAELGDPWPMAFLAALHADGAGVRRDYEVALGWFKRSAEAGRTASLESVAEFYDQGLGVEAPDPVEAFRWYLRAAQAGYLPSMREVVVRYWYGRGVEEDLGQAVTWARRAADAGDAHACFQLAAMLASEKLKGHPDALAQALGAEPDSGSVPAAGREPSREAALDWYREAARRGHQQAMVVLARHHLEADDPAAAHAWAERAAEAGDGEAMCLLGVLHAGGLGTPRSYEMAAVWFGRGAEAGDANALKALSELYAHGKGVPKNPKLAVHLAEEAKKAGYQPAGPYFLEQLAGEKTDADGLVARLWDFGKRTLLDD